MSLRDWVLGPIVAAAFVWQVSQLVGPFELGDDRPTDASRAQRVRLWLAGWRRRPRPALSFKDWMPPGGLLFLPTLISAGLVYGGVWVLFGPGQTFRLGGALALVGGVPLGSVVVGYLRRPVGVPPLRRVGERFSSARPGYRASEVDALFERLHTMTRADIEATTFHSARVGYDVHAVDDALEQAARTAST